MTSEERDLTTADAVGVGDEDGRMRWARVDTYVVLALSLLSIVIVALHVQAYPTLSPIDELQHIDYAIKAGRFEVVRQYEFVGQEAMREAACRSVDAPGYGGPACDGRALYDPSGFQEGGSNTAGGNLPGYYVVTGVGGRILRAITPIDSIVTALRMMGGLWLALSVSSLWYLMGEFGLPRARRLAAIGLLTSTPLIVFGYSTVNQDHAIIPLSVAVIVAGLRFERGDVPWWVLGGAAVLALAVEETTALAIFAVATYLVYRQLVDRREIRPVVVGGVILGLAVVPVMRILTALRRAFISPVELSFELPRRAIYGAEPGYVTADLLFTRLRALITPIDDPYIPAILDGRITGTLLSLTSWVLIAGAGAAMLYAPVRSRIGVLTVSATAFLFAGGPMVTLQWAHTTLPVPARYGLPLMPVVLAAVAFALRKWPAVVAVGALAAFSNAYVIYRLVSAL